MPVQDLIDRLDKALETAYAGPPPKPAVAEPAREPTSQTAPLRDDESELLSWAQSFAGTDSPNSSKGRGVNGGDRSRMGRDREVREFTADVPAASGSTFGRNVSKGFLNIGETSLGFFESLTDILGASKAKAWLKEKGDRLDELNRAIPNEIESFTDVEDAGDAGAFLAMTIGQVAPQFATALLSGGASLAAAASRGAGAKLAATLAGTIVPSAIQESGGIYRGVRDETGVEAPVTSLTFGAIAGALEAVTPSRFLLKVFDTGTDEIKRKSLASLLKLSAREILKETGEAGVRVGKAAAKTGLTEFGTEIGQEAIALGANKFADGTYDLINSKNAVRLIDAGLMGLVGGAALGSVQPSIERAIKYTRQQEDQNANETRTQQTDVEQERQRIDAGLQAEREDRERKTALSQARATSSVSDQLPQIGTVQEVAPPVVAPIAQGSGTFAQRAAPALDNRIRELHNLLIDSNAFGASEFYDATFPIPREGGIVAARSSQKYQSDPAYAAKVNASIRDITDTMVAANRQRMSLIDRPSVGEFGVNYSIQKARATYGVNVIRAWHNEAKQTYPVSSSKLGNISIRESFQNSLDAVMSAIQNGEIKRGSIAIDVDPTHKGFRVEDNGVGMSDTDIGEKFLSLHSTGKAVQGRFGGFGIAKAVILGPSDTARWSLRTRDNKFNNEMAEANAQVESVPFKQGTEIKVETDDYIIDSDAQRYVETTELPKNVSVKFNGGEVKNPFKGKKSIERVVTVNPQTSYVMTWYPRAPVGYDKETVIRLVDPKTGSKLTQSITGVYNPGFTGTIIVDITTTSLPGSEGYPLLSSRMGLKHSADKPVDELVAEKSVDVLSAGRQAQTSKFHIASSRSEWRDTIRKIPTDEGYQNLSAVIRDIWIKTGSFFGSAPSRPFTPLNELDIKIDTGFKGYHGGTMFQAKHLAAYEAASRLMAQPAEAPVTNFYGLLSLGGAVNAEHATGGGMGLNFLLIDKTSLKNPVTYALYLRDLIAHELTHEFFGPHNEEFTSKEIDVQRRTAHLFTEIVRIAEATLGKESELGQKTTQPKTKIVERIVERRVNVPVEVQTIVEKYLSPEQLQFIYDNAERDTPSSSKDDLYYPRQGNDQELWAEPIRTSGSDIGLSGPPENTGAGRGTQQPNPPSVPVAEQGNLGIGPIGTQSERRGSISPPTPPIPPVPSTGVSAVTFDIPAFKQRVSASNLSPEAKSFIDAFLNSKAAKYLEGARFRIAEALDGGWEGSYFKGLVAIAETATPGVAPQEFMHRIFDLLPEGDKQAIEALRQERLAELQAQYPNDPLLASITGAPMTTANFVAANPTDQQIADLYPVTTTDEFFAHMMSDKFVARTKGASRGLISTIREVIKDLVAAIKKGFRLPVTADEMFRNVINGRYEVTPEGGTVLEERRGAVVPITRQKTIERVAAFAKPGAERQTEALLATGQVTSVRNILGSFLKTVPSLIQDRVGRLVGFERMDAISTYVRDVLGQSPTEYAAARATLTDEGLRNLLAVHTNRAFELFEQNAAKLKALLARQQKKLTSPAWASKLRDLAKKRSKADATTAAREAMQLALKNGLDRAVKRIQESGGNDATFESAEQERQFYEQLLSRSGEVATAMDSIAKALGFTPDGVSIVFGKKGNNANDILTFYHMMVPLPPADPVTGRNPQFAINRVAAEILARNVTLRQQMVAALWAENAALAKPIATFEDQIVHDMQAGNPKTVIGKLIRQAGDLSKTEGKAAAAFMAKYRELLREVEKLEALEEAVRVVDATMVDKQYRAVRVLVATDAKAEIRPQDAKALETGEPFYSTSHIYLPDGTIVELNMFPDKARFQDELTKKLDPALTAINNWLFDPINADNPARAFYQQQYDTFKALWWSSTAVNPPKQLVIFRNTVFKMLDSMLGMLDPMLGSIGTRSTTLAQTAGQVWKDANHKMGDWLAKWNPLIVDSMARAAKSHPAIWEGQSRGAATDEWHSSVFVPLAASVQDPARPGYKVGDVIYESGEVVTQQDMDALELQVAATGASFKIDLTVGRKGLALPNVVEDRFVPGLKFLRRPIAFSKNMLMRRFDAPIGRDIGIAFVALKEKIAGQPVAAQRAALERFWNDHFKYVKSAVVNRNAQYSNLTEFEDVLAAARPEIANGSISNVSELVDFIFGRTLEDPEVITDWLFGELDRHATAIHKATATKADLGIIDIATVEDQNPFTVGRGGEIAPPAWYSYGFNDSRSIYNFSMSGSNFYFEILIKSLNAVSADLGAEISRMGTAIDALATKLGKGKEAQARQIVNRQNQEDIRLGRQTFDLETAADMKRGLDKLILNLNQRFSPGGRRLEEEFGIANKVWGDFISGVLFSSYTLARNALEGGFIQNGFRMSRLFGSTLQGFPRAFLGLMQTFLKVGGAGLWSLPVAAFKLRPIAGARALLTGNVLKAEQTFFGDAIRELATNMFERVQMFRDLEAAGLGMPAYPAETVQASAQYPLTFGQIVKESPMAETPFGRLLQNIGPGLLTFYDAQISLFLRPFFPRVGDQIANLAVANTTLGGIHNLEARIRKLFSVYRAAGVPIASLSTHVFTPSEILGKWFGIERTQTSLREIQQWFHKSLIPFNDSVFDYLTRLEKDPKAVWLTHEEKMRLIVTNAEAVNVATPLNRPELFKRNLPMRMVGGLLGWNVSALRNAVNNFTAVAASDPNFSRNQLRLATYTMFLATLAYSALGQAGIEEILRFLSWMLNNEERATRQPWEQEGADQAKQWAIYAFNSIPFVATAVNTAFSDLPNKAGFSPTLLAQQKVIDVLNYVSGAIRTRDVTYRLPQLVRGFIPLSPVVLNRLPATEGTVEALNASRLYRRYGDLDLIRRSTGGPGASATATRLTPYGDRILNALAQGDNESAEALKAEAVKVATSLGKPDPERSVEQSIVSRLPHRRAFKETPNAAQMARVMAKMSSSERAQVTQLNDTLKTGLDRMGIKTDFVDQPRLTDSPRSRITGLGGFRMDRPRRGRRSRLIGLSNRRSRTSLRLRSRTRRRRRLSAFF